ncbi:DUF3603 family protein [Aureibacillus halotolerans]|uniref:Uncharacterized protein DUF3603 n=1 Tax=Aureibacillus halotolerans TaxID=1508390 RepID=A0A4R6UB29_9BACI|nr:DUF3603 family protein [Aureibacillus halotolerans]TDQ42129.1 uncharacterized protein DUF3603 [Aureibacillus halotolerans]
MLYLHDVWVNWFEGEENGYNVCAFHEWRKEDAIEVLDQTPVLFVEHVVFERIENELLPLPKQLLQDVYNKSYMRKNHERKALEYCFIVTDGMNILAVNTIGYDIPVRKSRIIPRQEQLVYDMVASKTPTIYNWANVELEPAKEYHLYSPAPSEMRGLTRKERQLKQVLYMAMDHLKSNANDAEMRYWCTEWDPDHYMIIQRFSFDQAWEWMFEGIRKGWSAHHGQVGASLIRGQSYLEKLWELEEVSKVN